MTRKILTGILLAILAGGFIVWFTTSHSYVTTPSMYPNIKPGSEIFFAEEDDYHVGDVIKFEANGLTWAHRLVKINDDGTLVTKGDNPQNDPDVFVPPITKKDILGKVVLTVPFLGFPELIIHDPGYGLSWLRAELGLAGKIGLVALVALIAAYYIFDVRSWIRRKRRKGDAAQSDGTSGDGGGSDETDEGADDAIGAGTDEPTKMVKSDDAPPIQAVEP